MIQFSVEEHFVLENAFYLYSLPEISSCWPMCGLDAVIHVMGVLRPYSEVICIPLCSDCRPLLNNCLCKSSFLSCGKLLGLCKASNRDKRTHWKLSTARTGLDLFTQIFCDISLNNMQQKEQRNLSHSDMVFLPSFERGFTVVSFFSFSLSYPFNEGTLICDLWSVCCSGVRCRCGTCFPCVPELLCVGDKDML